MEKIKNTPNPEHTFERVWQMFQETGKKFQETDRKFKETDKKFQESRKEMERMSRETDKKFQETDRKFKETDKKFQESRREMERMSRETDKKINKISGIFSSQWGKLMESIIAPACLKLFKNRNIDVTRTYQNVEIKNGNTEAEFDTVLANGNEVVIVEVKTDMTIEKVNYFLKKMEKIKIYFPEHKNKKIYGAVAGIKYSESSDKYAYRKGLFVLKNSGKGMIEIANSEKFAPKEF